MYMGLHDNEAGNSLVARIKDIDYMYQAEQWVIETYGDHPSVIRWELHNIGGEKVQVWERPEGSKDMSTVTLKVHTHPRSSATIFGAQLKPGEVIKETDVYDSTSGRWEPAPCPGLTLSEGVATVWIRPGETR